MSKFKRKREREKVTNFIKVLKKENIKKRRRNSIRKFNEKKDKNEEKKNLKW